MLKNHIALLPIPLEELKQELMNGIREELTKLEETTTLNEEFIKSDEACKMLKISNVTLTDWRRRGIIKYYKLGSRVFFKRSEILQSNSLKYQKTGKK